MQNFLQMIESMNYYVLVYNAYFQQSAFASYFKIC